MRCGLCFSADYYLIGKSLVLLWSESAWNGYAMNINSYTNHDDNHNLTTLPILEYVLLPSRLWILREKKIIYRNLPRDRNVFFPFMFDRVHGCCVEIGSHHKSHRDCCVPFDIRDQYFSEDHETLNCDWVGHKETGQQKKEEETACACASGVREGDGELERGEAGGVPPACSSCAAGREKSRSKSHTSHAGLGHSWPSMLWQSPACYGSRVQEKAATIPLPSCSSPSTWLWGVREGRSNALSFFCLGSRNNFCWPQPCWAPSQHPLGCLETPSLPAGEQKEEHTAVVFMSRECKGRWGAEAATATSSVQILTHMHTCL